MKDAVLTEAINALTAWELRAFRIWLESPCFNRKTSLLRLYDYLEMCRSKGLEPQLDKASAATFDPPLPGIAKLRHEMSGLLKLLRDFLVWQELSQAPQQQNFLLLQSFRKRGLKKNFALALRETENLIAEEGIGGAFSGKLDQFRLEMEKHEWAMRSKRGPDFSFEKMATNLNAWYAGQLLEIACVERTHQAVHNLEKQGVEWIEPLLRNIPGSPQEHLPGVALYYYAYRMLSEPDNSELVNLFRTLLEEHQSRLPRLEARSLLMFAINHGIRRINEGDRSALRITLDFYLLGLEKRLLQDENGVLSKYTYNNVLMNFLALEEWEKARNFWRNTGRNCPTKWRRIPTATTYPFTISAKEISTLRSNCCAM